MGIACFHFLKLAPRDKLVYIPYVLFKQVPAKTETNLNKDTIVHVLNLRERERESAI